MPPPSSSTTAETATPILLGTHIPLFVFGTGAVINALVRMMVNKRKIVAAYRRMYLFSLFAAIFLIISTVCSIVGYYIISNSSTDSITTIPDTTKSETIFVSAIVFDYIFPMILWWVMFEILTLASYPRLRNEYPKAFKRNMWWSFQSISYIYTIVLLIVYLISALTINPIAGLSLIDILMGGYLVLLALCLYSQSRYQDVQPLGWSFNFFGFLIACTAVGGIVRGSMSVGSMSVFGADYAENIDAHTIIAFIIIKYFGAFALVLHAVAFPTKWAIHIQGIQGRYRRMNSDTTLIDEGYIEEQDNIVFHHQQQQ